MTAHPLADLSVLDQYAADPFPPGYPTDHRLFCAPRDNCHDALVYVLGTFQSSFVLAMYGYTDPGLVQATIDVVNSGIPSLVVLDSSELTATEARVLVPLLALRSTAKNLRLSVGTSEDDAIMHDKVVVGDGSIVCTGSTNWSLSGEGKQDNHLVVGIWPSDAAKLTTRLEAVYAYQMSHCTQP